MRVITFSRQFPVKHPKAGQPTFFVEQIYNSIGLKIGNTKQSGDIPKEMWDKVNDFVLLDGEQKKHHTIRAGSRWKEGDWFSPRVWSGKPYASKQIEFAPPIQIKKIFEVCLNVTAAEGFNWWVDGHIIPTDEVTMLAKNDGLEINDFLNWFMIHPKSKKEGFIGQILCWNESIEY